MAILCRACGHPLEAFMTFGQQPIANRFIEPDRTQGEYFFELEVGVCEACTLFQLLEQPAPEEMFHGNYPFFSQTSRGMQSHFRRLADVVRTRWLTAKDPFVVEIGSNDGIMLRHFADANIRHLGVEPSSNVADKARELGVNTITAFFGADTARRIAVEYGKADAILAANVMCHVPDLRGVRRGVVELLKPAGVLIFEEPYLGDVIAKTSYDQIYDEHVFLFTAKSVRNAFAPYGLELIDVEHQSTHGGSVRYTLGRPEHHVVSDAVKVQQAWEKEQGLWSTETLKRFRENCERSRSEMIALLTRLMAEKKSVVGYAATSKSTTVLNYCNIGPELISYICDTTPIKQGKVSPGMHIPIKAYEAFKAEYPDYAVLFAWNHAPEIFEKEQAFKARGGKWITFVPKVQILE